MNTDIICLILIIAAIIIGRMVAAHEAHAYALLIEQVIKNEPINKIPFVARIKAWKDYRVIRRLKTKKEIDFYFYKECYLTEMMTMHKYIGTSKQKSYEKFIGQNIEARIAVFEYLFGNKIKYYS